MSSVPAAIDQLTINSSIDSSSINSISSNLQPTLNQQQSSTQDQERSHYHSNIKDHHHHDLPIRLILIDEEIEDELHFGLKELCSNSIRNNLNFFDLNSTKLENLNESINQLRIKNDLRNPNKNKFSKIKLNNPQYSPSNHSPNSKLNLEFWWFIQFQKDPLVSDHQFSMTTSHSNFFHLSNSSPNYLIDTIKDLNQPLAKNGNERFCIKISYKRKSEAFRALGHLLGLTRHFLTHLINKSSPSPNFELNDFNLNENLALTSEICIEIVKLINNKVEICKFETLGIMIDCSRNGVLKLTSLKDLIRLISLMGLNILQLYTEDTYEISNEPFFGYFRGPYNQKELKDVDDYADSFGIEVVACIQTLGHLGQMLQWPRFGGMRDTHEVLLVGSQEVYDFIEKMIISITKPLRSKKIHIGMDEAHGVSEGRYRQLFGIKDSCQV
ncbi:hypothetical protein O181_064401, partial [Austropuccinia psidii MF-1]|nr:hypothetical protein [Austropuccinia psidii MF-1]